MEATEREGLEERREGGSGSHLCVLWGELWFVGWHVK